jgi:Bacteriophage probable baseplate hub protein
MAEQGNLLRVARPTINVAGEDDPRLASSLLKLAISENTQGLFRCEATFGNWDASVNPTGFLYFDRRKLDFGKAFKIKFGTGSLFDGRIMGIEASFPEGRPPELTVLAEDRFQDLRMTRRTRTFTDVTDAEVMSQIANEHGLSPAISVQGPSYKVLAQVNQSDLAFLRERARSVNAELWMDGSKLNVKPRASRNGSAFEMTHGKELREFAVLADLANQRSTVCVNGWDVAGKTALQHEASDSVISGELNGDTSGASILGSALARRKEALAHAVPLTAQEAQAIAESFFRMTARRFLVGRGVAETSSRLRVGGFISIKNIGPLFSGRYYLAEVRHVFDGKGLRTEFTAERAGLGKPQ